MVNMVWKAKYSKGDKPPESALLDFWSDDVRVLFEEFSRIAAEKYGMSVTQWSYTAKHGWKLKGCIKSIEFIKKIIILNDGFIIDEIVVKNRDDLEVAITYILSLYTDDFVCYFNEQIEKRNAKQSERSKRRIEREAKERSDILNRIDASRLNQFKWQPKVPRQLFLRLYKSHADMMLNEHLLDDIGLRLYVRCVQGRDERLLADQNKLKCHNCNAIVINTSSGYIECDCGSAYKFKDYMRSFNENSMPSRSATPFFNEFIDKWPNTKNKEQKMLLIDWIIHKCHLNLLSGVTRHFAGVNLIEGTKQQVSDLILKLAYD
ncbi:MAG: hypothetical protein LBD23_17480 [Oscillospiraceae bacterium]|jgi:uridine kinase|nr:hypothetical protein [Oscillospiraceae bacterium]